MHGQTLETIWSTRRIQLIDSNHHFDLFYWIWSGYHSVFPGFPLLDCWHARHLQKPRCMMQIWEQNTCMFPAKTEPRGSEKWSLERFGTAKMPSLRCWKKSCGAEVYRSICAFHHQNLKFLSVKQWIAWCHVESKREVAVVSLTCFAAFPDCQFCSHWFAACAEPPGVYGSRACEGGPKPANNCCLPVLVFMEAIILCNQNGNLKTLIYTTSAAMT